MKSSSLYKLPAVRQKIWVDSLTRRFLASGALPDLVASGTVSGVTTNLDALLASIAQGGEYDLDIMDFARTGLSSPEILRELMMEDSRQAAELVRPVYEESGGADGLVSMDLCLASADDTTAILAEAHLVWRRLGEPNVLLKMPATRAGLAAGEALIEEGISVELSVPFDIERYDAVTFAYLDGLRSRVKRGKPLNEGISVASIALNRIDAMIDPLLEELVRTGGSKCEFAAGLRGRIAIAWAKVVYRRYKAIFEGAAFAPLAKLGARPQRLVWADTRASGAAGGDMKYVEALSYPETIMAMHPDTLAGYRDHGHPKVPLDAEVEEAQLMVERLHENCIRIKVAAHELERQSVGRFGECCDTLIAAIDKRRALDCGEELKTGVL